MNKASVATLVATVTLTWGAGSVFGRSSADGPRPTITLRIVNEAGLGPKALLMAKEESVSILNHSGIDLIWLACESGNPCQGDLGPTEFWMRIVVRKPSATSADMLGFSDLKDNYAHGSAAIYYTAAAELARSWEVNVGKILGAAVAHEVGHLLLGGVNAHSAHGVMYAHWSRTQFEAIDIGKLYFTSDQARRLHDEIRKRTQRMTAAKP